MTEEAEHSSLETLYDQFPEIDRQSIRRPSGRVDVLLGMDYRGFHPVAHMSQGHLRVSKSKFGSGYVLTGTASSKCSSPSTTQEACSISQGTRQAPQNVQINHVAKSIPSFWEAEDLGCAPLKTCKSCKSCPDCRYHSENQTGS